MTALDYNCYEIIKNLNPFRYTQKIEQDTVCFKNDKVKLEISNC